MTETENTTVDAALLIREEARKERREAEELARPRLRIWKRQNMSAARSRTSGKKSPPLSNRSCMIGAVMAGAAVLHLIGWW